MKVKSNAVKKQCCLRTWNDRSMNQDKLDVVKQEMARININILGISELNDWEWANLIQMTIIWQESHRRNGAALIINKRVWNTVLECNLKNCRMISVCFQGKPFNMTVIEVYAQTTDAEKAEVEQFYEDLPDLLGWRPKKICPIHHRGLECKSKKPRDTWNNRQVWPWSTKWTRAKANKILPKECTGHSKHPFSTTQEVTLHMDITRWLIPKSDWLHSL